MMKRISRYMNQYLNARLVFLIDFVMSVASSALVLLLLSFFATLDGFPRLFPVYWAGTAVVCSALAILVFRTYRIIIRHTNLRNIAKLVTTVLMKVVLMGLVLWMLCGFNVGLLPKLAVLAFIDLLVTLFFLMSVRLVMYVAYEIVKSQVKENSKLHRVMIYNTTEKSIAIITRLLSSNNYKIVGFLSREKQIAHLNIRDYPVYSYSTLEECRNILQRHAIEYVLFSTENDAMDVKDGLIQLCSEGLIKALVTPSIDEIVDGKLMNYRVREVKIEDLLGRPEIRISMDEIVANFHDKVVMVTGAAGSIGSELCRQLAGFGVRQLVLFDNAETPMHNLRLELEGRFPELDFVPVIGDVRHVERLDFAFRSYRPAVVFHAAAYKHVPLMEENPCEAVRVNVSGSRNVADKCIEYGIEKMVMISTDKAVNPTNIMGCSKRLAEIYVQSLGLAMEQGRVQGRTRFVTTRFGNVLGSNGSVIPRFREQIAKGGPVTVTDPRITRFFMTIPEACRLVMEAATMGEGNRIYVFDMGKSVKIDDLARRMIKLAGYEPDRDIQIQYTGLRPGEKLYEEVLSNAENTLPTGHERIRIAEVRQQDYEQVLDAVDRLARYAIEVNVPDMVRLMKATVPEFKSRNSPFEKYDTPD